MVAMDVRVAQDHRKRLVSTDALDGWQIDTTLYELRDCGVPHDVRRHDPGIEPSANDGPPKRFVHTIAMTRQARCRARRGEYPSLFVRSALFLLVAITRQAQA